MVHLTNFNCVVGEVVVDHVWQVVAPGKEAQHFAVVVQELLLRSNFATAKCLLHELLHFGVSLDDTFDFALREGVHGALLSSRLRLAVIGTELAGEFVAVVDANLASVDTHIGANAEIAGLIRLARRFQNHLPA